MNDSPSRLSARQTHHMTLDDAGAPVDMAALRAYRLDRVQDELNKRDLAAVLLYDPLNIRYATGHHNMTVWALHNRTKYCLVPAEGKAVLFDYKNAAWISEGLDTLAEVRPVTAWFYFHAAQRVAEKAKQWAGEIDELMQQMCGGDNKRLAVDHLDPHGTWDLQELGYELHEGEEVLEQARAIKSMDEVVLMNTSLAACDAGMARMREELRPGMTENELWAYLHFENIRLGGEWMETRLLSSGPRTNPWMQESSDRVIRPGDLVSFDTDMIGPYGYCSDVSRTFFCGPGKPSDEQRKLFGLALEQVHTNMELCKPGVDFKEFSEKAWRIPNIYVANRYGSIVHGVGLADEWPRIVHADQIGTHDHIGTLMPGMTVCVESYMGAEGGTEGVKLEQQMLITETGCELLSTYPFEEDLLG